jgi:DNA-binding HxlR family transcriptional regulator
MATAQQKSRTAAPVHAEKDCPMTRLIGAISSKWAMPVLYNLLLAERPIRFGELRNAIGPITQRELSRTLKHFEGLAVVTRKSYPQIPPRVEYSLTALGRSLRDPILALGQWAQDHAHQLRLTPAKTGKR